MRPITDTVPAAQPRVRGQAHTTPRVLPIRPEPVQSGRLSVPYTGEPITVTIDVYDHRSGADLATSAVLCDEDGREVVIRLLSGNIPLPINRLDLAAVAPIRQL